MRDILRIGIALTLMILGITSVVATSCAKPEPASALEEAETIFVGKVTDIDKGIFSNKITFEKETIWKGDKNRIISIYIQKPSGSGTGYNFEKGEGYLIYAYQHSDGKLWVDLCEVKNFSDADEEIRELDAFISRTTANEVIPRNDDTVVRHFSNWLKNLFL